MTCNRTNDLTKHPGRSMPAVLGIGVTLAAIVLQSGSAFAVSAAVKRACMSDYFAYCSSHAVGSPGLRSCMNKAGPNLSKGCVAALVSAGEISKTEVDRRQASR